MAKIKKGKYPVKLNDRECLLTSVYHCFLNKRLKFDLS